jgi:tetratricopeptide (TPR) repeat protein
MKYSMSFWRIIIISFLYSFGSIYAESEFQKYFNVGKDAKIIDIQIVNYTKSIELWDSSDGKEGLAIAYNNRGIAYENKEEIEKAIVDFNKAIEVNPKFFKAYYCRGHIFANLEEYDKAIGDLNMAIKINPKYGKAYNGLGIVYNSKNDYEKALYNLNMAINLDPKNDFAYISRGYAFYHLKKYNNAITDYNIAIELSSENPRSFQCRGWVNIWLLKWEDAKKDFEKAILLNKNFSSAYCGLGVYYWKAKNDKKNALLCFKNAFQQRNNSYSVLKEFSVDENDGHFIDDLKQTQEFQALIKKYFHE